jgi:hypothetical protein
MLRSCKDCSGVDKKITEMIVPLKVQKKRGILSIPRETLEMVLKLDTSKLELT